VLSPCALNVTKTVCNRKWNLQQNKISWKGGHSKNTVASKFHHRWTAYKLVFSPSNEQNILWTRFGLFRFDRSYWNMAENLGKYSYLFTKLMPACLYFNIRFYYCLNVYLFMLYCQWIKHTYMYVQTLKCKHIDYVNFICICLTPQRWLREAQGSIIDCWLCHVSIPKVS